MDAIKFKVAVMALFMKRANNEFCYCWSACGLVHTQVYVIDGWGSYICMKQMNYIYSKTAF